MALIAQNDDPLFLQVEINNGDLKALNEIISTWNFKDKESALRFAIAVLNITKPGTLFREKLNGARATLVPTEELINKDFENGTKIS